MNEWAVGALACPVCHGRLISTDASNGDEATLRCEPCRRSYPVVRGVPRMVAGPHTSLTAESFGFQWSARAGGRFESETLYGLSADQERADFFERLGVDATALSGKTFLDAGCGDGFLLQIVAAMASQVMGVDVNPSIEVPYRRCRDLPNVTVAQADILSAPFASNTFDYVWCEGVLVCLEEPRRGFDALARLVKPGGRLYVWLYPSERLSVYQRMRDLLPGAHRLPHPLLLAACRALAVPLAAVQLVARDRQRWESMRTMAFNLFDNLSPVIQTRHTVEEIRGWFRERGFSDLKQTGYVGMSGTKTA